MTSRHLSLSNFEAHLKSGVAMQHPIDGNPRLLILIDPHSPAICLRIPREAHDVPAHSRLRYVDVVESHDASGRYVDIRVTNSRLFLDAYLVLCAIADRIQLHGLSLPVAMAQTLHLFERILQTNPGMTREKELGLLGELLVFIGLCRLVDPDFAIDAWRGAGDEEHDFGVGGIDIEVKTTASERRSHWIGSLTQLRRTGNRPLWLVSHQLTEAGVDNGWLLTDVISAAWRAVNQTAANQTFQRQLEIAGWRDEYADACAVRWHRRTPSVAFAVADDFPALTPALLLAAHANTSCIREVNYRIDLTDRPPSCAVPSIIAGILNAEVTQ